MKNLRQVVVVFDDGDAVGVLEGGAWRWNEEPPALVFKSRPDLERWAFDRARERSSGFRLVVPDGREARTSPEYRSDSLHLPERHYPAECRFRLERRVPPIPSWAVPDLDRVRGHGAALGPTWVRRVAGCTYRIDAGAREPAKTRAKIDRVARARRAPALKRFPNARPLGSIKPLTAAQRARLHADLGIPA